jgi:SAM-dependent methyltransferase
VSQSAFIHRPTCELCRANRSTILYSKPFDHPDIAGFLAHYYQGRVDMSILSGIPYEIALCENCDFIWQTYILNDEGMRHLYNRWIGSDASLSKKEAAGYESYLRQAEVIALLFPDKRRGEIEVLDFGMGWGYWCLAAMKCGYRVAGLEISAERVQSAREKGVEVIGDLDHRKFDFINAEQVFEHIPQPLETLTSLSKTLNPGGVIRIGVPDGKGMTGELKRPDWKPAKNALHPLEHINCFTRPTLIRLGESADLHVVNPPPLLTLKYGAKGLLKSIAGRYYRQFKGTTLYFGV